MRGMIALRKSKAFLALVRPPEPPTVDVERITADSRGITFAPGALENAERLWLVDGGALTGGIPVTDGVIRLKAGPGLQPDDAVGDGNAAGQRAPVHQPQALRVLERPRSERDAPRVGRDALDVDRGRLGRANQREKGLALAKGDHASHEARTRRPSNAAIAALRRRSGRDSPRPTGRPGLRAAHR